MQSTINDNDDNDGGNGGDGDTYDGKYTFHYQNKVVSYAPSFSYLRSSFWYSNNETERNYRIYTIGNPEESPRLSTIKEWNPNDDAYEEEDNFLDSDDEEILKNYNESVQNGW